MFCRGDGGGIASMIACIGGGGGIGIIVLVVRDIGVDGGGDGAGGGDGNVLRVLCVDMAAGHDGGVGIPETSVNFVDNDETVLLPSHTTESVAIVNGDGGGGGGGIKDVVIKVDVFFENASSGNGGGYDARFPLGAFA